MDVAKSSNKTPPEPQTYEKVNELVSYTNTHKHTQTHRHTHTHTHTHSHTRAHALTYANTENKINAHTVLTVR